MKYSIVKKLINKDIDNIYSAFSNNNEFNLTETFANIKILSDRAKILSKTMKSNIKYNVKINDSLVNLWTAAEEDTDISSKISTYGKDKYTATVLLYLKAKYNTIFISKNIKILYSCSVLKSNINLIEYNTEDNNSEESSEESTCNTTIPTTGCELDVNSIYLTSTGNILYNIPTNIYGFQFKVVGATINSISGGDAETAGFTVQHGNGIVLGFSFNGSSVDNDCGTLTTLNLTGTPTNVIDIIFSTANGIPITVTYYDVSNSSSTNTSESNNNAKLTSSNISLYYKLNSNGCLIKKSWDVNYDSQQSSTIQQDFIDACKSSLVNNILIGMS